MALDAAAGHFERMLVDIPDAEFKEAARNVMDTAFLVKLWLEDRRVIVNAETILAFTDLVLREHRYVVRERQRKEQDDFDNS